MGEAGLESDNLRTKKFTLKLSMIYNSEKAGQRKELE